MICSLIFFFLFQTCAFKPFHSDSTGQNDPQPSPTGTGSGFPAEQELISILAAEGELLSKLTGSFWEYIKTRVCVQTQTRPLKNTREKITGSCICQ